MTYPEPSSETVRPAVLAWYALKGELEADPAEVVAWAADTLASRLGAFGDGVANPLSADQGSIAIKEAKLLLGMIAEIFGRTDLPAGDEARLAFKAELKRARGRPVDPRKFSQEAFAGYAIAKEVEALIANGDQQKSAVGKVAARLGLTDSKVARYVRKWRDNSAWLSKNG